MQSNLINYQKKHQYFNEIYDDLHPQNNKETRIYNKYKPNFDFSFKNNKLTHLDDKEVNFNKNSFKKFKTFDDSFVDMGKKTIQNKISYHLTNNLVPVKF